MDRYSIAETGHRLLDEVSDILKEIFEYVDKMEVIAEEAREFIRDELYWLAEWIHHKTQL